MDAADNGTLLGWLTNVSEIRIKCIGKVQSKNGSLVRILKHRFSLKDERILKTETKRSTVLFYKYKM